MLNLVSLLGTLLGSLHIHVLHAVSNLRSRTGVSVGHAVGQYTMGNLLGILVVIPQRLGHDKLLQWHLVVNHILQLLLNEGRCLTHVLLLK